MTEQKLWELIKKICHQTQEGKITWDATVSKNRFQTAFPKFTVEIGEYETSGQYGEESMDYRLTINDESGKALESISDVDVQTKITPTLPPGRAFATMRDLYNNARRRALGVDAAIDALLSSLEEDS